MKRKENAAAWIKMVIIAVFGIAFLTPLIWMVLSSFKATTEVFSVDFYWLPSVWRWENRSYLNTIFITVIGTLVQLVFASLAAYAFAKIPFKGKNIVFLLFLSTMMIPVEVTIIPRFMLFRTISLYDNLWAVILPTVGWPFGVFLMKR